MNRIITIGREYGAGGHTIGQRVAKELDIPFYDRDIIRQTAEASGYTPELVEAEGEDTTPTAAFLSAITSSVFYNDPQNAIHDFQAAVMLRFAKEGPCVLLGRAADDVCRRAGVDSLDVFIHADQVHRAMRVRELLHTDDAGTIEKAMARRDASRHAYYTRFTGKRWGECRNYDLTLDSGELGYDLCVQLICAAARAL